MSAHESRPRRRLTAGLRRPESGLLLTLAIDGGGVAALIVLAVHTRRRRPVESAVVGIAGWLLAAPAVARIVRNGSGANRLNAARVAQRLLLTGLMVNTLGTAPLIDPADRGKATLPDKEQAFGYAGSRGTPGRR